ncbi:adenine-specific methyltransferase EcoRI family protein [Mycoplasmopsis agassizii]|uniref:adenine-specific methyltransferase EcoRI family protein n=1 Tax=Mycoplasmopsis agassizii TaxID=33922 RepID=UPI003A7F4546
MDVPSVSAIPSDYDGVMGVPITFLDKYNPEQFQIVGLGVNRLYFTPSKIYQSAKKILKDGSEKDGSAINNFLIMKTYEKPESVYYTADNNDGYLIAPYVRILIKRK